MESRSEYIQVKLADDQVILVEAAMLGGEEDVSFQLPKFEEVLSAIEGVAGAMVTLFQKVKPQKAAVEFGVEFAVDSGQLTALIVKGTGKSNLKITLQWGS